MKSLQMSVLCLTEKVQTPDAEVTAALIVTAVIVLVVVVVCLLWT